MKRKTGRKSNGVQVDTHLVGTKSKNILASECGESAETVQRYIRLTNLIPELLDYQFITDRNLDTVEQVEDYKAKCIRQSKC